LIGVDDRGNPLGNDNFGDAGELGKRCADAALGGSVYRAGGVVKNQNLRAFQQGAGDTQPLFLTAGDIDAALA